MSRKTMYGWAVGLLALLAASGSAAAQPGPAADTAEPKLILVTVDGMRWQDLFRGADPAIVSDKEYTPDSVAIQKRFLEVPEHPTALMPFLLNLPHQGGLLAGNRDVGSCVNVTNPHWFSYPGYSEILTGTIDPAVDSNDRKPNAAISFLEAASHQASFANKVRVFASWDVFPFILNTQRSGLAVNAGYSPVPENEGPETTLLNRLMRDTPRWWDSVRLDAFTHQAALESLHHDHPRILYVAYGETDDFAHEGRYDQYLRAAARTDGFIQELWRSAQADPYYAGQTTLIVTTDHGRGYAQRGAWKSHGAKETAEDIVSGQDFGRGSDQTWIAMIGPAIRSDAQPLPSAGWGAIGIAATALQALDIKPQAALPMAAALLPVFKPNETQAVGEAFARVPDLALQGVLTDADKAKVNALPFDVPLDTAQVHVEFSQEGAERGTSLWLGVSDPQRSRGWGGTLKRSFSIGEAYATPSFLSGPIPAGRWHLLMTAASIRPGDHVGWHARIWFSKRSDLGEVSFSAVPVTNRPGWYRGDLHSHSGQSDGRCRSVGGKDAPCPIFLTLQAAVAVDLDFLSLTDHNTTAQFADLGTLQPYFDTLVLLPGREITTRYGHANLIGPMGPLETELTRPGAETMPALLANAHATGGFLTINHPALSTGEDCLGCGWSAQDIDYRQVDAIEAVNAGSSLEMEGSREDILSRQIGYWQDLLDKGYRLVGVAGSDNHDPIQAAGRSPIGPQSPVGYPTTVIYAETLSQGSILAGLHSGRAFIDLGTGRGRVLDMTAALGPAQAGMGGTLPKPAQEKAVNGTVHVEGAQGGRVELIVDGKLMHISGNALMSNAQDVAFKIPKGNHVRWFRANVRTATGDLLLVGNPIWIGE